MSALPADFSPLAVIGTRRVAAADGSVLPSINPATGEVLTELPACGTAEIDAAVAAARARFEAGTWRDMAPRQRKAIMLRGPNQ